MSPSKILWNAVAFGLALLASFLMLKGSGFFPEPSWLEVAAFAIMIVALGSHKISFYGLLLPMTVGYALYAPVGLTFGAPTYQYIASVFATDLMESREFLQQIAWSNYVWALGILLAVIFYWKIANRFGFQPLKNKGFVIVAMLLLALPLAPFKFYDAFYSEGMKVKKELEVLNNLTIQPEWGQSTLSADSKYDDYVLVIGESARKDYHNAYGYPADNTPFMSHAKGTLIDGFTSGGTNTIASLRLMLTKPDPKNWESNYKLGLVDLIKSAGIQTYWISNQGYLGRFDTPISSLANKSDVKIFTKAGDSLNQNISDFALLPKFENVLQQPHSGKRFIVVHLYGSHPISCDRLTDYPKLYDDAIVPKKYYNVNCYVSSIKKTDEVLQKIYQALEKNQQAQHRSFSMIYFSDHGLSHEIKEDIINIHNSSGKSKLHYNVPLFKISSDDTERHVYKVFKSGLNFTDGMAKWIGIDNPLLNKEVDLFSNQPDKDDYGLQAILDKIDAPVDPAVAIPLKHK